MELAEALIHQSNHLNVQQVPEQVLALQVTTPTYLQYIQVEHDSHDHNLSY